MDNEKVIPSWLSVLYAVLCVAGIGYNVYNLNAAESVTLITGASIALQCMTFALAICYCFQNYSKSASAYFTAFCACYALANALVISTYASSFTFISSMLLLVRFGILCVFMLSKNLGKKKSMILSAVLVASEVIHLIINLGSSVSYIISQCFYIVLSLVFVFMIIAKYSDKKQRGTT